MILRKRRIVFSSAALLASGAVIIAGSARIAKSGTTTTLNGSGVSVPSFVASGCTPGLHDGNSADFIDNANVSIVRLQPRDCGIVKTGTPSFSWVAPPDRAATPQYYFWLNKSGTNETIIKQLALSHPFVNLTSQLPNGKLDAGTYYWTAAYVNSAGKTIFGRTRYFQVASGSDTNVFPSGAQIAATVSAKPFPRVLPANVSYATIAARAQQSVEYKAGYNALIADANDVLAGKYPIPTADTPISGRTVMWITATERRHIEELGLATKFTSNSSYAAAGVQRLMALAQWSPTGLASQTGDDQGNREILLALSEGIDLYRGILTNNQINTILIPLKARILSILNGPKNQSIASFDGWPNDSHMLTDIMYLTQALLHIAGYPGFSETTGYLATAWEYYLNTLNTFTTEDGGYANGVAYAWYNLGAQANVMAAVRSIGGVDVSTQPAVSRAGRFLMAMTPANIFQMSPYGDGAERNDQYQQGTYDAFKLYSALISDPSLAPAYEWYWRVSPQNNSLVYYPGIWHFMLLGMNNGSAIVRATPAAPTNMSWLFENTGAVAMHNPNSSSDLTTATSDTYRSSVFFHSGRFGSFNHSQADQNAFTLVSNGRNVLISGGYYTDYNDPYFKTDTRATRYKNALTFDGGIGQAEPNPTPTAPGAPVSTMMTNGRLLNMYDTGSNWVVSTGDATSAYQAIDSNLVAHPLLSKVIRTVAYDRKDKVAVIYDYATSDTARTWELNFQSMMPFNVNGNMANTQSSDQKASACLDMYDPVGGSFVASQGFDMTPPKGSAQQYHARYSPRLKSTQLVSVTIIREGCAGMSRNATFSGSQATVTVNGGAAIVFDKGAVIVPN